MAAQLSDHDELVGQMRAHIPAVQDLSDRAYAVATTTTSRSTRNDMERVGNRAADLVIALGALKVD
jgi:hypothetical protein